MKTYCLSIFWGLLILVQTAIAESSIPECTRFEVDAPSTGIHQLFREKFPFHLQTVGIDRSNATADTVILAEPPFTEPNAHEALLKKLPQFKLAACEIRKHPIGYDGWVKDLVLTFPKLSDDQAKELLSLLHRELFGTDYKADTFDLTRLASEKFDWNNSEKRYDFDIRLPASEIRTAFLESDELRFVEITQRDGKALSARELLAQGKHGVFVTTYPGFVVWALKQKAELPDKAEIRHFALESDLILGAVADEDDVLVLARKRIVPMEVLPPVRAEDLVLLTKKRLTEEEKRMANFFAQMGVNPQDKLFQSYERNYEFAGKLLHDSKEKGKDWAPAELSPVLVDSHFGSVLNVADNLLKGWSEHGFVTYEGYGKYLPPQNYPFDGSIFAELNNKFGINALVYNWNTNGVLIQHQASDYNILTFNRTGSMAVSYKPEGSAGDEKLQDYESKGYDYFSTSDDSYLAQVIQHVSLFKVFREFSITAAEPTLVKYDVDEFTQEEESKFTRYIRESDDGVLYGKLNSADLSLIKDETIASVREYVSRTNLPAEYSATLNSHLLKYLWWSSLKSHKGQDSFGIIPEKSFRTVFADIEGIKQRYASYIQNAKPDNWIRTPSIVVSTRSTGGTGGHDFNAKAPIFMEDLTVEVDKMEIKQSENGFLELHYNPKNASSIYEVDAKELYSFIEKSQLWELLSGPLSIADLQPLLRDKDAKITTVAKIENDVQKVALATPIIEFLLTQKRDQLTSLGVKPITLPDGSVVNIDFSGTVIKDNRIWLPTIDQTRAGKVLEVETVGDSSKPPYQFKGTRPLHQSKEVLFNIFDKTAKVPNSNDLFIYQDDKPERYYLNGKLISLEELQKTDFGKKLVLVVQYNPSPTDKLFTVLKEKWVNYARLADGAIKSALKNSELQQAIMKDGEHNIVVVVNTKELNPPSLRRIESLKSALTEIDTITFIGEDEFEAQQTKRAKEANVAFIIGHSDKDGKNVKDLNRLTVDGRFRGKTLLVAFCGGEQSGIEEFAKSTLSYDDKEKPGALSVSIFSKSVDLKHVNLLFEQLAWLLKTQPTEMEGVLMNEAIQKAIQAISNQPEFKSLLDEKVKKLDPKDFLKLKEDAIKSLQNNLDRLMHNDWWQYYPNQQYAWG